MTAEWPQLQQAFIDRLTEEGPDALETGTVLLLPSLSFSMAELLKITGVVHYEERLLCMTLLLRNPELRMIYVTSLPVDPAIVDYYLSLLPDPADAAGRLTMVSLGDADVLPPVGQAARSARGAGPVEGAARRP